MNIFNKYLNYGTKEKLSSSDNKRITLTNKISFLFSLILLALSIIVYFKINDFHASIVLFSIFIFSFLIPLLNKAGLVKITGFIISIIIPLAVLGSSTFIKINNKSEIDLITYIAPRIFLLAIFVVPLITINHKRKFIFYNAIIFNLIVFIGYGEIQNFFNVGIENAIYNKNTYFIVNITSLLSFFAVFFSFLYLQSINSKYDKKLTEQNNYLNEVNEIITKNQEATEKLNQEFLAKSLEAEQAKYEIERFNKELLLQQEATEKLNQEIFAKSLEAEQARQELEDSTELIRSQAALSEILRNVTGKERSVEQFLNDALNKLLTFKWLNILDKGSISIIDDNNKEKIIAEKNINNKKVDENIEEIILPLKMADLTFGTLKIYKKTDVKHSEFIKNFFNTLSDTITSVINRKKTHNEIIKTKKELEEKNKHIRKYTVQLEQQTSERESLNQMILAQKKQVEQKNKEVQKQKDELELYAKELEKQSLEQETITQKLFAQKLEVEQRNMEVEQYSKQLEEQAKEQETLNQKLFAQKLEVEQRNMEVEQYSKQLEEHSKEQEALNQKLFAQKLEVEQRNVEVQEYLKLIEQQNLEQEKLNQQLFAQKMEVEQRSFEVERSSKEIAILKDKAEGSLKHLNDSINYSKYIQDSLLPLDSFMDENIPGDYFVYYKPKETIGGDFYYANKIDDYLVLAVADCTGHGVPGALITMLGITFLNDIVDKNLVDNAGAALNLLRKRIKTTFRSYGDNLQNKNGLDIALCAINLKTNIMQFSGAFNPLYIFRENELLEYKATRNPIGYYPVEKEFTTTEIKLQKDDVLYLFSDGYPDQIGGPKNRKFSKRQFKDLLQEIHTYPIAKQKVFTEKIMQRWMDGITQVDDITLMGIKWNN